MTDFLSTGRIRNAVNVAPLEPKVLARLRGYLDVAHRLGTLMAGLQPSGITSCKLTYRGEIAACDVKVLTAAFSTGLLEHALGDDLNLVNAQMLLQERGIDLSTNEQEGKGVFRSSVIAEIETDDGVVHAATGTVFGETMPRLVALDGYRLEAYLDGCLLVFTHKDVPGIIGGVGAIFGEHQVNIAQMAVGRAGDCPGGEAVGILNLDSEPSAEALEAIRNLPAISSARVIHLPPAGTTPAWLPG